MAVQINSDNKEILLYENGSHVIRAEMELDYGHKIITSNVLNIELNESLRLGINFISENEEDKIVINKKN
jgi:hypothetical protein